jgi:hypothetical protein
MNVDASLPQPLPTVVPHRPVPQQNEQTSARPVERPHQNEAADNQQSRQSGTRSEAAQPRTEARSAVRESESRDEDRHEVSEHDERAQHHDAGARHHGGFSAAATRPSSVGKLLDVIA